MLFHYEIERIRQSLIADFSAEEISAMTGQAITDLKNRNIAGVVIVPLSYLVGGFATDYAYDYSFLYSFIGCILVLVISFRAAAIVAISKKSEKNSQALLTLFFWGNLGCGLAWGAFSASAVLFYHDSLSITLIIILLAGISGGSLASYFIWRSLSYSYLLLILLPPLAAELYIGNSVTIPIGIAIAFFLIFNLIQAKVWNKQYWISLANTFLVRKNSRELALVNEKLAEEIEDHKQTSQHIAISRRKLRDIYNSAHDAIFIFGLDGQLMDVNETMLQMFHAEREKTLKSDIFRRFSSTANPDIDLPHIWQEALKGLDQEFEWIAYKQGEAEPFPVQVNLRKTLWGKESVVIATVRDVSIQVKAMKEAQAANRAKSEFLANISHELRTPMHGILGYANLGRKRADTLPRAKIKEYYSIIFESGSRLMSLLNNLLDFSRLEVGKMHYSLEDSDLLPKLEQIITELSPLAEEKGLSFDTKYPGSRIPVYCDLEKIGQVLRNLLFNAVKFSERGSPISIVCEQVTSESGAPLQRVSVVNVGVPIPEAELEDIFGTFTQSSVTNTGAGGTGLGLAIARQIMQDHGSRIWAENAEDGRTIFRFLLARVAGSS